MKSQYFDFLQFILRFLFGFEILWIKKREFNSFL